MELVDLVVLKPFAEIGGDVTVGHCPTAAATDARPDLVAA
jgi:hypothetical protein